MTEAEAQNILKASHLPFGDRLDRLVEAIADAHPDRPAARLEIAVAFVLPNKPEIAATISCRSGTKKDIRWVLGVLGVPTEAIPGHRLVWQFHKHTEEMTP